MITPPIATPPTHAAAGTAAKPADAKAYLGVLPSNVVPEGQVDIFEGAPAVIGQGDFFAALTTSVPEGAVAAIAGAAEAAGQLTIV